MKKTGYKSKNTTKVCENVRKTGRFILFYIKHTKTKIYEDVFENGLGMKPKFSPLFVSCFKNAGFNWGGDFKRVDGMHYELAQI